MSKKYLKSIPNLCSMTNAFMGLLAILMITFHKTPEAINIACIFILIGAFLDSIDGLLARYLEATTPIGKELDSFADIITFGIAPMVLFTSLHCIGHHDYIHPIEIVIAAFYIICAIYRLARYNVSEYKTYFEGLPTTASGMIMSMYIFLSNIYKDLWFYNEWYTVLSYTIVIILGLLMISKVKVDRIAVKI